MMVVAKAIRHTANELGYSATIHVNFNGYFVTIDNTSFAIAAGMPNDPLHCEVLTNYNSDTYEPMRRGYSGTAEACTHKAINLHEYWQSLK